MTETLASPTLTPTATIVQSSPPISNVFPIVTAIAKFLYSFTFKTTNVARRLISLAIYPAIVCARAPLPLLQYLLSPLFVFVQLVLGLFFVIPYQAFVSFFDAVQPIYIFCGVACITGALVGLGGRLAASFLNAIIEGPGDVQEGATEGFDSLEEKRKAKTII